MYSMYHQALDLNALVACLATLACCMLKVTCESLFNLLTQVSTGVIADALTNR